MAHSSVRRCHIGALQPGNSDVLLVALVINKSDPKKVTMKKDGAERWVTNLTLRDSPSDMINLTVWSSAEEAATLKDGFHIGSVVEIVKPRVLQRDLTSGRETYSPQVTSPFQLSFQEGRTVLCPHFGGDSERLIQLLNVPSKASSTFLSINDIVTNSGALKGHFVDILAAVRKVGTERRFAGKNGEAERGLREVRLFDQTADSLVLKLWDSEHIMLAEDWIPRENILFLADVRIDWDEWRTAFILTGTSKTVITVNPDTMEAAALVRFAQLADFSSVSRLDQFVAAIQPQTVTKVVNVLNVQMMREKSAGTQEALQAVSLYGFLSRLDLDCEDTVTLRCGRCCGLLTGLEAVCVSMDCEDFNVSGPGRMIPSQQYYLRADVSDETGSLSGLKVSQTFLTRNLGPAAEFARLSDQTKTAFKWQFFLRPMKITLALMLPTSDSRTFTGMVVEAVPATLEEICAKMPTPAL